VCSRLSFPRGKLPPRRQPNFGQTSATFTLQAMLL
jgi:hypothetical protein